MWAGAFILFCQANVISKQGERKTREREGERERGSERVEGLQFLEGVRMLERGFEAKHVLQIWPQLFGNLRRLGSVFAKTPYLNLFENKIPWC